MTSAAAIDNLSLLRFAELIEQRLGLQLDSSSLEELELVLCARIRALRCGGFDSYRRRLEAAGSRNAELGELAQKLAIGETYFFRSSEQFTVFSEVAIPRLMRANRARPLRILSAGCATGEEPYSLAITIRELGASAPARVSILGFDINPESIAKARAGRYSRCAPRRQLSLGINLSDSAMMLKSEELRTSFDRTFAQARVERSEEFVHLLIVRIGTARFALKVADLAGLARAQTVVPIPGTHPGLLGLAGLKGRMVAVYSLATLLGTSTLSNEPERWFVLCRCEERLALGFTAAEGTLMVPSSELSPVSPGAPPHATDAVGTGPARMWLLNVSSIAESIVKQAAAPAASAEPR